MLRDFSLRDFGASLNTVESYTNESSQGKIGLCETANKQKCTHLGIFLASDFKCQGKTVNPEIVIDKINEINQDCCLSSWLYEFEEEWTNIMKSYDIKNQNAYFKTCVWTSLRDYLSKSDNLSMYYSNLLLER